jgi:hypothetical protein
VTPKADELAQHVTDAVKPALALLAQKLGFCAKSTFVLSIIICFKFKV